MWAGELACDFCEEGAPAKDPGGGPASNLLKETEVDERQSPLRGGRWGVSQPGLGYAA